MLNLTLRKKIILINFHLFLGLLLYNYPFISTYIGLSIIILGTYLILFQALDHLTMTLYLIAYIVGFEVLLRMCESNLLWEFGKYSVIYFVILGMSRQRFRIDIQTPISIYFLLLLPSIINLPIESFNSWRQSVAFNLAGPACIFFLSNYLNNQKITNKKLINIFFFALLPIISMSIFVLLRMPSFQSYTFMPYSDPTTSGGYGPNQVSTIFGFIITCLFFGQITKNYLTKSFSLDLLCLVIFTSLGLLTFSRGGMLGAIISISFGMSYFFYRGKNKIQFFFKTIFLSLVSLLVWFSISTITNDVIQKRYNILGESYGERLIIDLTGRAEVFNTDLKIFVDNPITGVGPGMAKLLRPMYGYRTIAAHTEFSRMLSEHGILGLLSLILIVVFPLYTILSKNSTSSKTIRIVFSSLALLTMIHTALRIAMPCFIYALLMPKYED